MKQKDDEPLLLVIGNYAEAYGAIPLNKHDGVWLRKLMVIGLWLYALTKQEIDNE